MLIKYFSYIFRLVLILKNNYGKTSLCLHFDTMGYLYVFPHLGVMDNYVYRYILFYFRRALIFFPL